MEEKSKVISDSEIKDSIWKNKNFLFIWTGSSISNFTFYVFTIALPLLIYETTKSTLAMSAMRAIEIIPNIVLGVFIGALVDRYNRKKSMLFVIGAQVLVFSIITLLYTTNTLQIWHLYLLGFLIYTSGYAFGNLYHTVLPLLVSKKQLTSANASINLVETLISLVGPAFAGFILLNISYQFGLMLTVLGCIVLWVLISMTKIKEVKSEENTKQNLWLEIKEGWHSLIQIKELWTATIMILCVNIASAASGAILIFYAVDNLGIDESQLGLVLSISGLGGITASLLVKKTMNWLKRGQIIILGLFGISLGQLINFFSEDWYVLAVGTGIAGASIVTINIHYLTIRQETTPNHLLGRVAGTSSMIMKLAMPISYLLIGAIGDLVNVKFIFLGCSVFLVILAVILTRTKIREFE